MITKLQTKILIILVLILAITIGTNNYIGGYFFKMEYSKEVQSKVLVIGQGLMLQLDRIRALGITLDNLIGFEEQCQEIINRYDDISYAMVIDTKGTILFHNDPTQHKRIVAEPLIIEAVATGQEQFVNYSDKNKDYIGIVVPVLDSLGNVLAAVVLGVPEHTMTQKLTVFNTFSTILAASFILLSLLLITFILTIWVTKPLKNIIEMMGEAGRGNLDVHLNIRTNDEIGQVGRTFNRMVKQIRDLVNMTAKTTQLQQQVESELKQRQLAETLRHLTHSLSSTLQIDKVLRLTLENLRQLLPYDRAVIWLIEESELQIKASQPEIPLAQLRENSIGFSEHELNGIYEELSRLGGPIVKSGGGYTHHSNGDTMFIPLILQNTTVGMILLESTENHYGDRQIELAFTYAGQAGIAIENAKLYNQMQVMAETDELTKVYNRRHFFALADREFHRAQRYHLSMGIIMFDIDYFKDVNDLYGHLVGDEVLRRVAIKTKEVLRTTDILARYGGEEFVILLPETDLDGARITAERIRDLFSELKMKIGDNQIRVTVSLGVSIFTLDTINIEQLLKRADEALYAAKYGGRNCVVID